MPGWWLLNEHLIQRIFCEYPSIQLCTVTGTGMSQVMPMKGMSVSKLVTWGQLKMHCCACVTSAAAVIFAGCSIVDLNERNATCPQHHFLSYTVFEIYKTSKLYVCLWEIVMWDSDFFDLSTFRSFLVKMCQIIDYVNVDSGKCVSQTGLRDVMMPSCSFSLCQCYFTLLYQCTQQQKTISLYFVRGCLRQTAVWNSMFIFTLV